MNTFDKKYKELIRKVRHATLKPTRQGIDAHMIPGAMFEHSLRGGFPLTTLRKIKFDLISSELQFNLLGLTDKKWLQDRNNHIWDDWCDPSIVPYKKDEITKRKMKKERDLGPLYGFEWRHFGAEYRGYNKNYTEKGIDQIKWLLEMLKSNPESRRMVVTCWNPSHLDRQSIPPCPFAFEVSVFGKELHLFFFQRSVDIMLGFPFDFGGYALLLHLLSKQTGLKAGKVTGYFGNVELYVNQEKAANNLLIRNGKQTLPRIKTEKFSSILEWEYTQTKIENYEADSSLKIEIAV